MSDGGGREQASAPQRAPDDGEPTLEGCFAEDGTDLTLIASALEMTPTERLAALQSMVDFVVAVRRANGRD